MRLTWESLPQEELNKQINPIYYGATRAPEDVLPEWRRSVIAGTIRARAHYKCHLDIPYGRGDLQKYDVYGVDLPEDAPIFVFIHGGAWQTGSKERTGHFPLMNKHNGFRSIATAYTLAPEATIRDMEVEVVTMLQKIVKDYPKANIVLAGHSAGGQLAAHLLHSRELPVEVGRKIVGLVLISGVYDLRAIVSTYINDVVNISMEDAAALSPMLRPFYNRNGIDHRSVQILVTFGGKESDEFHRQSQHYYEKLKEAFPQTQYWVSGEDDHFTIIEGMADVESPIAQRILQFLQK
jgi:arylformamidase